MLLEHKLFTVGDARAYTPMESEDGETGIHGALAQISTGDWSWKPYRYAADGTYRLFVTGPRCTCTLSQPVGTTNCKRHQPRSLN